VKPNILPLACKELSNLIILPIRPLAKLFQTIGNLFLHRQENNLIKENYFLSCFESMCWKWSTSLFLANVSLPTMFLRAISTGGVEDFLWRNWLSVLSWKVGHRQHYLLIKGIDCKLYSFNFCRVVIMLPLQLSNYRLRFI